MLQINKRIKRTLISFSLPNLDGTTTSTSSTTYSLSCRNSTIVVNYSDSSIELVNGTPISINSYMVSYTQDKDPCSVKTDDTLIGTIKFSYCFSNVKNFPSGVTPKTLKRGINDYTIEGKNVYNYYKFSLFYKNVNHYQYLYKLFLDLLRKCNI